MTSKNILFIFGSIFFLIGIFVNNITKNLSISLLVLLILVVLFLGYFIKTKKYEKVLIISTIGLLIGISFSDYNFKTIGKKENMLGKHYNSNTELILRINDLNKVLEFQNEYEAKLLQIGNEKIGENIKVLVKIDKNYDISKGFVIKTKSKIYPFEDFNGFSYKNYMLSKNTYFKTNIYSFEIIEKTKINFIEDKIIKFRKSLLNNIYEIYPKEEAIFLGGILLGARESLPEKLKQDFNNSGLTHFIAVSGFNITIIIVFLSYIIRYFPVILRIVFISSGIVFFTILVGDTAPVVRASIMGLIGYFILVSGRKGNLLAIILFTASLMVIMSPLSLNYDVSLHLSFLAVLGIMYTQKFFEKTFHFLPNFLEIKTAFTLTLSALSFTLPIMIFNFGQMSMLSPFANIAVTWTIPIAMLLGFLSIIVYYVYPIFGIIIGYFTWIFLKWDIIVVHFFGNLDFALLKFDFGIYKNHFQILYFIILLFLILWFRKKEEQA